MVAAPVLTGRGGLWIGESVMPDWCMNRATFAGDEAAIDRLVAGAEAGELLNTIRPMPEGVFRGPLGEKEWAEHGSNNWYDWSVTHWGTKWDASDVQCERHGPGSVTLQFDTAWGPPLAAYDYAVEGGLSVEATYCEPGCCFIGRYQDGEDFCHSMDGCPDDDLCEEWASEFWTDGEDA